jgi:hypothetical protein
VLKYNVVSVLYNIDCILYIYIIEK